MPHTLWNNCVCNNILYAQNILKKLEYNYCEALYEEMAGLKKQTYNLSSRERQTTDTEDIAIAREAIHG